MPFIEARLNSIKRYVNESAAYAVEKAITDSGIEAGIAMFKKLKSDVQNTLYFSENDFNSLGYNLITPSARNDDKKHNHKIAKTNKSSA